MDEHDTSIAQFLDLSAGLTGFSRAELQGTGMLLAYFKVINYLIDSSVFGNLLLTYQKNLHECDGDNDAACQSLFDDPMLGPLIERVAILWYLGQWNQMPRDWRNEYGANARDRDHVISAEAYREGLAWRAMGAHPMGAKQQGFGAWSLPPPPPPE